MDIAPLLAAAMPVLMDGLNALTGDDQQAAVLAINDGAACELRISIRDGVPAILFGLSSVDGDFRELGRLSIEGMH